METMEKFRFTELSEAAKQRAIERYEAGEANDWSPDLDDLMPVVHAFGFDVEYSTVKLYGGGTRQKPAIEYDVGYGSSGYAAFPGWWRADDVRLAAMLENRPTDEDLRGLAARMMIMVMRYPLGSARVRATGCHSLVTELEDESTGREDEEGSELLMPGEHAHDLLLVTRDLCGWIGSTLNDDYENCTSHENIAAWLAENDDRYDEDGDLL